MTTQQRPQTPQHTDEWERHLSLRALTELRENEENERADRDAVAGRGAAAWAIIAAMVVGAAITALTIYATVILAMAH